MDDNKKAQTMSEMDYRAGLTACVTCGHTAMGTPVELPVVAHRREWGGDVSDEGMFVYATDGEELDHFGPWQKLADHATATATITQLRADLAEAVDEAVDEIRSTEALLNSVAAELEASRRASQRQALQYLSDSTQWIELTGDLRKQLEASRLECERLRVDAGIFAWLWPRLSGRHWREAGVIYSQGDEAGIRAAIDAAMKKERT